MKNNTKKILIGCGTVIGVVAVCYICDKLFGNHEVPDIKAFNHDYDYQEFWLKDGTNAFIHTCDGEIDHVEFNCQSLDSLIEAAGELKELAADTGYDTGKEFTFITFSELC